jgi:ribonuclease HII
MSVFLFYKMNKLKGKIIAGMDEAGRGPWAGPVVAGAVILPPRIRLPFLTDSKKLSEKRREKLYDLITNKAIWGVGEASHKEVDELGLTKATNLAYKRALKSLPTTPDHLLIDGRDKFSLPHPYDSIIKGDLKVRCISAASIIAKVTRDRLMKDYDKKYPGFHFASHKGYGTRRHHEALKKKGISPIHRISYKPIQPFL